MPTRDDLSEVSARSCVEESCAGAKVKLYETKKDIFATIAVAIQEEKKDDDDDTIADSIQTEECCAS